MLVKELQRVAANQVPSGELNRLDDLAFVNYGAGKIGLSWSYKNRGDYDLNGEVNVNDLTPLGQNFRLTSQDPGWDAAKRVDGDGNGEINLADVTPIGQGLRGQIGGYKIFGSSAEGGPWTLIGVIPRSEWDATSFPPKFICQFVGSTFAWYLVNPYDFAEETKSTQGARVSSADVQAHLSATPTIGPSPLLVQFDGSSSVERDGGPLTFAVDLNGDGIYESNPENVNQWSYTYDSDGSYRPKLRVTDEDGNEAYDEVAITVGSGPIAPEVVLMVNSTVGYAPLFELKLDASASSDPSGSPLAYTWDINEDGRFGDEDPDWQGMDDPPPSPTASGISRLYQTPGTYSPVVRVFNEAGLYSEQSVEITVKDPNDDFVGGANGEDLTGELDGTGDRDNDQPLLDWWFVNVQGERVTSGPAQELFVWFDQCYDPDVSTVAHQHKGIGHIWVDIDDDGTWEYSIPVTPGDRSDVPIGFQGDGVGNDVLVSVKVADFTGFESIEEAHWYFDTDEGVPDPPPAGAEPYQQNIDWSWNNPQSFGVGPNPFNWFESVGNIYVPTPAGELTISYGYNRSLGHKLLVQLAIASYYANIAKETGELIGEDMAWARDVTPDWALHFLELSQKHNDDARQSIALAGQDAVNYAVARYGPLAQPEAWVKDCYLEFVTGNSTGGSFFEPLPGGFSLMSLMREWNWID